MILFCIKRDVFASGCHMMAGFFVFYMLATAN